MAKVNSKSFSPKAVFATRHDGTFGLLSIYFRLETTVHVGIARCVVIVIISVNREATLVAGGLALSFLRQAVLALYLDKLGNRLRCPSF